MCGRLNITSDPLTQLLMEAFGIGGAPLENFENRNAAPTESVVVVRPSPDGHVDEVASEVATYRADALRWWLTPSWSAGPSTKFAMFNARSETLGEKRSFARPFRSQRCVVPVSGYYEWQRGEREKLPFYVHSAAGHGLLLAGLWDSWTDKTTGEVLESFSIVTAAAHEQLLMLHHRQPVFLSVAEAHIWLDHKQGVARLSELMSSRLRETLKLDPVSTHVNNARHKDERCLQPIAEPVLVFPDATGNADLFAGGQVDDNLP